MRKFFKRSKPEPQVQNAVLQRDGTPVTILIVDDSPTETHILKGILERAGYRVITAENGERGVSSAIESTPSLILMDVKMPKMNGIDATKEIKKLNPAITVIAQTAYAFSTERDEILAAGCSDYISKPVPKEKLLALIEKYL